MEKVGVAESVCLARGLRERLARLHLVARARGIASAKRSPLIAGPSAGQVLSDLGFGTPCSTRPRQPTTQYCSTLQKVLLPWLDSRFSTTQGVFPRRVLVCLIPIRTLSYWLLRLNSTVPRRLRHCFASLLQDCNPLSLPLLASSGRSERIFVLYICAIPTGVPGTNPSSAVIMKASIAAAQIVPVTALKRTVAHDHVLGHWF